MYTVLRFSFKIIINYEGEKEKLYREEDWQTSPYSSSTCEDAMGKV